MEVEEARQTLEETPLPLEAEFAPRQHEVAKPELPLMSKFDGSSKALRLLPAVSTVGLFLLGIIVLLYFSRVFFLPLVLALVLSFLFRPVIKWMARFKVPAPLGAAVVLAGLLFVVGNGVSHLTKPATDFVGSLPANLRRVETKLRRFIRHAEQLSKAAAQVEDMTKGNTEETPATKVEVKPSKWADGLFLTTTTLVAGAIETIVLLYFLLAYGELFLQKLVKVLPNFHEKRKAAAIAHEVQQNISVFLFTITLINVCLGTLVGLGVYLVGLGNAILWGATAALLNFIPYFGPIVGVCILALAGLLTFDSVGHGLVPPLIYLGLHALESNFITPLILGRRLTLNPLLIFISLMFWTWLWGVPGALLSVPLLMMLKIFCDHFKLLAPIGEFLSG